MVMEKLYKTSKLFRQLIIREFHVFNAVIPRETFKVNNITKLLTPFIKNYRLKIQIDELKKTDLLAVI